MKRGQRITRKCEGKRRKTKHKRKFRLKGKINDKGAKIKQKRLREE
jgi:hypothetical protein